MTTPNNLSRRLFLQRAAVGTLMAAGGSTLAACASGGSEDDAGSGGGGAEKTNENPFGVKEADPLDVVIFKGGYGDDYAKAHEELYKKKFPAAEIKHAGITDITPQLQPRFNGGNPPDVIDNSGASLLPMSTLASTGQLADLTELFDAPSIDDPNKKVRDTVEPITLEAAMLEGKPLVLDYVLTVYALWYNKKLFAEKGWQPAKTWTEFLALCEEIKKAGIAPLAHQGKHPYYIGQILLDMAVKHGGQEVIKAIDSLEPNAWKHPSIKLAAEALLELKGKGYMMQGTEGLDHIQSQTAWNQGKAAFIPSGSWLENEQKPVAPKDFETTATFTPLLDGAKLPVDCTEISAGENFIVPSKAKNRAGGLEYLRIMLSKEAAGKFTEMTGSPTVVKGAAEGKKLSPGAASASALLTSGGTNNWVTYFATWYSTMDKPIRNVYGELAAARVTADEFCNRAQKVADDTAKDPKTKKQTRS
ncbi:carbohydrate ABC transporter, N-acetylglucosamine/diacetylchitobiose-binding protein [Kribbella sp. ALI-6-A]|uniref:N-acetylglucosamine/diacetylchitobiose ABC transporter substrate-binding protein n=1 Tax=Kribbella sp. ALI-6-A TaxID=1933817 RepID=UPI00097C6DBD|nr:N-acetylglucosamine/diacetylchitobiose ABC transporter substrate-binding protein [Kribbella sp. ALI-6-A]ONI78175.1 carbohydrate ABC transporter, N-acetylglucosamine/diacetylchitobiose-binding protein [Kribbella sp. ALI-6-A]